MGRALVALAGLFLVVASPAFAQASAWADVEGDVAQARLVSGVAGLGGGGVLSLGLQIRLEPGWHTYWRQPGEGGIPPVLDWAGSTNLAGIEIAFPLPKRKSEGGLTSFIYENEVVLPLAVRVADPARPLGLRLQLLYGVCKDICIPAEASLALDLPPGTAGPTAFADLIAKYDARVPRASLPGFQFDGLKRENGRLVVTLRSAKPLVTPDLVVEGDGWTTDAPKIESLDQHRARLVLPLGGLPARITAWDGLTGLELALTAWAD
ncbi:MAG: hypothetical protein FJX47_03100 [Alphaproteobacteria bacterium]|nr:hypothetical protein [Alphaproteobacteria bacterium]